MDFMGLSTPDRRTGLGELRFSTLFRSGRDDILGVRVISSDTVTVLWIPPLRSEWHRDTANHLYHPEILQGIHTSVSVPLHGNRLNPSKSSAPTGCPSIASIEHEVLQADTSGARRNPLSWKKRNRVSGADSLILL